MSTNNEHHTSTFFLVEHQLLQPDAYWAWMGKGGPEGGLKEVLRIMMLLRAVHHTCPPFSTRGSTSSYAFLTRLPVYH
jgi:hypothetical protein